MVLNVFLYIQTVLLADIVVPPLWAIAPFVLLLLMIATGPLLYKHFWHKNYPKIAVILALLVVLYYLFSLQNVHSPVHAFFEYFQFISLLTGLFIISGGINIDIQRKHTPMLNVVILAFGAIIANIIGTTGASMLLIRPFININKKYIRTYHIVFFIFIVSNLGGALTPVGDPPLFLGYLKGVPFFWTLEHNVLAWVLGVSLLLLVFYIFDLKNKNKSSYFDAKSVQENGNKFSNKIRVSGKINFLGLAIVVGSVFLDPNIIDGLPAIEYHGVKFSFIRELIMLSATVVFYLITYHKYRNVLKENEFSFEPIKEVAFIFVGIFGTMMPALDIISAFAGSPEGQALLGVDTLYWGTGILSAFLDNAPTYINFLAASMASTGANIQSMSEVVGFASGEESAIFLKAISISAVFFGAFTYIGNGPNFMVRSIAEQLGIDMPSFFGYVLKYSIPILLPVLFVTWYLFFY